MGAGKQYLLPVQEFLVQMLKCATIINSIHVHTELRFCTAFAQMIVGDLEVVKFGLRLIRFGVICANGLNDHIVRQIVLFAGIDGYGLGCELLIVRHITVENGWGIA